MPSSWDVYYVVFLSAGVALGIPASLAVISRLVSARPRSSQLPDKASAPAGSREGSHDQLGRRMNARFFLSVNAALVLITIMIALIPCAGMIRNAGGDSAQALRALLAIVTLSGLAGLGLLYSSRKGDLSWIRSFEKDQVQLQVKDKDDQP